MIVYNTAITYFVLSKKIEFFSEQTSYGWMTIAEVDNRYYHLDNELVNLQTAIKVWELINSRKITIAEYDSVIIDPANLEIENEKVKKEDIKKGNKEDSGQKGNQ